MTREELARLRDKADFPVSGGFCTVQATELRELLDALEAAEQKATDLFDEALAVKGRLNGARLRAERAKADLAAMTGFRDECERQYQTAIEAQGKAEADLADEKRRHAELRAGVSLAAQGLAAWSGMPGDEGRVRGVEHSLRALLKGEPT